MTPRFSSASDSGRTASGPSRALVLAGQPNCGKSTLFNDVVGYHSVSSNFPGATVSYTRGDVRILGSTVALIDLPGVYSLTSLDPASRETQRFLLGGRADVVVNVVDASVLSRSLELTLQLLELEIPMVLCLNMMDEAERKGIRIDTARLGAVLGVPVVKTVASRGSGVRELFWEALKAARSRRKGSHQTGSWDIERAIGRLQELLEPRIRSPLPYSTHLLATKLLEQDPDFEASAAVHAPEILSKAAALRRTLERTHGKPADAVIAGERHALSMSIAESVCVMEKPTVQLRDRLDGLLMHNVWGYVFLFAFMFLMFQGVFRIGAWLEKPLLALFDDLSGASFLHGSGESPWTVLARGALLGIGGGIAVVVPYLVPFLFGLAFFEDLGYLPRVAFLLDAFMHRIGLHGTAVIPAVMGYGCNVPAVMATRILDSPRDRFIATMVAAFVPCSARTTVVFGLVGATIGATAALSLYGLNLAVVALAGAGMARLLPESAPGMILEIPPYRLPNLRSIAAKVWLRLKDFVVFAWPLLIFGSAVLGLIDFLGWSPSINHVLSPLTGLLGLPSVLGVPLVFGVLRKELSMLMLFQAIGTNHPEAVLSALQLFVYTLFVVFYIPCLGTIGVLVRQVGFRRAGILAAASIVTALCLCAATRLIAAWLF